MAKKKLERENPYNKQQISVISHSDLLEQQELIQNIPIEKIVSPSLHDRKSYSQSDILSLAQNIQSSNRLLQPIVVRKTSSGYERIIGFRRIEAVKTLGWKSIPSIVLPDISDEEAMLLMLSENIQREDLNLYDQTVGILEYIGLSLSIDTEEVKRLLYHFRNFDNNSIKGMEEESIEKREKMELITKKLGKITVSTLINRLKIFSLSDILLEALKEGKITYSIAVELNKLSKENDIPGLLVKIETGELSLRDIKALVAKQRDAKKGKAKKITYRVVEEGGVTNITIEDLSEAQSKKLNRFLESL